MRALLLGGGGMLGRDLAAAVPGAVQLTVRTRAELDITDSRAVAAALDSVRPDWVINASAYTAVDRAEEEREIAFAVNGAAVGALGAACAARGVRVAHFSTDYVFPGTGRTPYVEEAPISPVNTYGASKLAGEQALSDSQAEVLLLRTQWLFGIGGRSFPRTMWGRATRREPTRVVADQWGRPTYTLDLARATWELIARGASGVYHVSNSGSTTWFDLALEVFAAAGAPDIVTPCTTAEYPTPARRPAYSVLSTTKVERILGAKLPSWQDGLARMLAELAVEANH